MKRTIEKWLCAVCILICSVSLLSLRPVQAEEQERKTVRVGYYPVSDYQDVNADGSYEGFAYDYYVQIQKYTRWNYEYVEASYADCMKMLASGEIDIMSGLTESEERQAVYDFSEYSNSNTQNKFYARAEDDHLFYESYEAFDGCRIGMVKGVKTDEVEEYCNAHHFHVDIVLYNSYAEIEDALAQGEIDLLCGASVSDHADTKIVARMKKQPLYYAVTKGKSDILEELDDALQKITDNNPEFYTQMSEKYKINGANAMATFTREEDTYIHSGKQIYLIVNTDLAPLSWLDKETGEYKGLSVDVAREIEAYSGLKITAVTGKEFDDMVNENPEIMGDALVMTADDTGWAESMNIMMTNHVINSSIVMISKTGKSIDMSSEDISIALPKNYYVRYILEEDIQGKSVQYYDTVEECLDAVNKGIADVTYMNSILSKYYLSMLKYTNLYTSAESGYAEDLSFGVYIDADTPLLSILDKSLLCIGSERINQIAVQYAHADEKFSLVGLYYSNPVLVISMIVIFCGLLGLTVFFRLKAVNAVNRSMQERTLARFMGYVCAANENVLEVNLQDLNAHSYSLNEYGEVEVKTIPYQGIRFENKEEMIYPEDFERLTQNMTENSLDEMINENGGERYFECRYKNQSGRYQWYSFSLQAIPKDKEHPRNFILFKKNIDSVKQEEENTRRALEDALETAKYASEAKGSFLSRVSHEIRTPLNAIIGYISMARQSGSSQERISHCLENSEIASKHLLSILNDVLDMSSIESGKLKLANDPFDIRELLDSVAVIFRDQAEKKGVNFKVHMQGLEQKYVLGDRMRVNQIMLNLLSNSVKFTDTEGTIELEAEQVERSDEKCRIRFVVRDTGIGMSEEYMNRLFKPFEQENAKTAQKYGGTGLGLSIAWNLVTMMGGSIDVKSSQGVGTSFTVLLTFGCVEAAGTVPAKGESTQKSSEADLLEKQQVKIRAILEEDDIVDGACMEAVADCLKKAAVKCDIVKGSGKLIHRVQSRMQTKYAYQICLIDQDTIDSDIKEITDQIHEKCGAVKLIIFTSKKVMPVDEVTKDANTQVSIIHKASINTELPVALAQMKELLEQRQQEENQQNLEAHIVRDFTGLKLLLAEDNEMNLEIAVDVLTQAGFVIETASDGKEAVDKFTSSGDDEYKVILMDVQMPIMDGYEATRQIRASKHPQAKSIPIIAATANAFSEDVSAALACGMNGHISKPIDYKKLYEVLDQVIE